MSQSGLGGLLTEDRKACFGHGRTVGHPPLVTHEFRIVDDCEVVEILRVVEAIPDSFNRILGKRDALGGEGVTVIRPLVGAAMASASLLLMLLKPVVMTPRARVRHIDPNWLKPSMATRTWRARATTWTRNAVSWSKSRKRSLRGWIGEVIITSTLEPAAGCWVPRSKKQSCSGFRELAIPVHAH